MHCQTKETKRISREAHIILLNLMANSETFPKFINTKVFPTASGSLVLCKICNGSCGMGCDFCLRSICHLCESKIDHEVDTKLKELGCKWCKGSDNIENFCPVCESVVSKEFAAIMRLSTEIQTKKYKTTEPVTKQMVWDHATRRKIWICSCYSGVRCDCKKAVKTLVLSAYGVHSDQMYDFYGHDDDPQHDISGEICFDCFNTYKSQNCEHLREPNS